MAALSCTLALLCGAIGAGFASGREIMRFFAGHGHACAASIACALLTLAVLLIRLPLQMERLGCSSLAQLCILRFGQFLGRLCVILFFLLNLLTGSAMLAACAELIALVFPVHQAYTAGLLFTLLCGTALSLYGLHGLRAVGIALCLILFWFLLRLLALPAGEACFLPAMAPDQTVQAALDGAVYGALNAAMLAGILPLLLALPRRSRNASVILFIALFTWMLLLGVLVCRRHSGTAFNQPLPFIVISRSLGKSGYLLAAASMYAAAFSTLLAMLSGMANILPYSKCVSALWSTSLCLLAAQIGFVPLVESGYPTLGSLCAGLMLLLCFP
ncbi:MAG: hypothetical protein IJ381_01690 [Clostridia bacterium]|nr:hypothetical protein [Clostridia bacterium]